MVKKQFFGKRKFIFTCVILILAVFLAIIYQNGFLGLQDKNYFANTELNKIQNVKLNKGDVSKVQFEIGKQNDVSQEWEEVIYTVNFNWLDDENVKGLRPESIDVVIYKDGEYYDEDTVSEATNWSCNFYHMIDSMVQEEDPVFVVEFDRFNGYRFTQELTGYDLNVTAQIEGLTALTKNIYVQKDWNDNENEKGKRPETITVNLNRDGVLVDTLEVSEATDWKGVFVNVPKYKNSTENYTYTVDEVLDVHYDPTYDQEYSQEIDIPKEVPADGETVSGLRIHFSSLTSTELNVDTINIYYKIGENSYRQGSYSGKLLSGVAIDIPSTEFWIYMNSDNLRNGDHGFSIDYIEHTDVVVPAEADRELRNIPTPTTYTETAGDVYPESAHLPYGDSLKSLWYYDGESREDKLITNTYRVVPTDVVVHYYKDGTEEKIIEDLVIPGYAWDNYSVPEPAGIPTYYELVTHTDNLTGEFAETTTEVIYYYKYKTYNYKVEYYYEGEKDNSKTENLTAQYADEISTYTDKVIRGYEFDTTSSLPLVMTDNEDTNLISVYYTKRTDLGYTVKYIDKETREEIAPEKNVNGQVFEAKVTENAIDVNGYVKPTDSKTISIDVDNNLITFEYEKRTDLSYTVRYLEQDTNISLATAKIVNAQKFKDVVTENAIEIDGYVKPTESKSVEITTGTNEIIFYYTKRQDLTATIYVIDKDDNTYVTEPRVTENLEYLLEYTVTLDPIDGYNIDGETSKTITIGTGINEIKFYVTKRTDLSYTIKYIDKETKEEIIPAKVVENQRYLDTKREDSIDIDGYVNPNAWHTFQIGTGANEYTFEYEKRTDLSYKVQYLEETNNVIASEKIVENRTFKEIVTEEAIPITGYVLKSDPELSTTIEVTNNVITFYYTKRTDLSYTVRYMDQATNEIIDTKTVTNQRFEDIVTESSIEIDGYNKVEPTEQTLKIIVGLNQLTFYYTKRTDLSYKVQYVDKETREEISTEKVVENKIFKDTVTEVPVNVIGYVKPTSSQTIEIGTGENLIVFEYEKRNDLTSRISYIDRETGTDITLPVEHTDNTFKEEVTYTALTFDGYIAQEPTTQTIEITVGENHVIFYYVKRKDLSYKVKYLDGATNAEIATTKVVENQTFKDIITEEAIEIDGYVKPDIAIQSIEMTTGENLIEFIYNKRTDLGYTVEYIDGETDEKIATTKEVENRTFDESITEEAIEIDGYVKPDVETQTIKITTGINKIVFEYIKRKDLSYTVYHRDQETGEELKPFEVIGNQTYKDIVEESALTFDGYNLASPEKQTVEITTGTNEIIFNYTKKNDLTYKVQYLEKNTNKVLAEEKLVANQVFKDIVTEEAIEIDGYVKPETTTQNIEITTGENTIKFYYTKRTDLSYVVKYLEKDTNKELATEKLMENQIFEAVVTEDAIEINGYNKVDPITKSLQIAANGNEMIFYYTKRTDLSYTVEYLERDTNTVLMPAKVVENQMFESNITEDAIEIDGYNKLDPTVQTIEITTEENKITFYYTKRTDLGYTIYYKERETGEDLQNPFVGTDRTFKEIVECNWVEFDGYNLVSPETQTIEITTGINELTFYYTKRTDLNYKVEYLEKDTNIELAPEKEITNQTFKDIINESAIDINGYDKVDPKDVSIEITTGENKITFYYTKRTDLNYAVKYIDVETGEEISTGKVVYNQTFKAEITETAVDVNGYVKPTITTQTIEITTGENIIIFEYIKRKDLSYTVEYLEKDTNRVLAESKLIENQTFKAEITETALDVNGFVKPDPETQTIVMTTGENKIVFYYTKRTDLSYTVKYLEENTNEVLSTEKVVKNQVFEDVVTEEVIEIDGYVKPQITTKDVEITTGTNEIVFYYTKRTDLSYTVKYLEKDTNNELATEKLIENQTFKEVVTENAIDIYGFIKPDPETLSIEITTGTNEIIFYYARKTDLTYIVKYLEKDTNEELAPEKVVENQIFEAVITEEAIDIEGYVKPSETTMQKTMVDQVNEFVFYYTKRTDLSYTVKYLDKDTNEELAPEKVVENQRFKDVISETYIEIDGYIPPEEKTKEITIKARANEIIFYYTKRSDLSYTVKYIEQDTNEELVPEKVVENQIFKLQITESAIEIPGYVKVNPIDVTIEMTTGVNEITFYYTKNTNLKYTIEYYYEGTRDDSKTINSVGTFLDVIDVYEDKVIPGYIEKNQENFPLTISSNEEENIIKIYYEKDNFEYTVHYYYDGVEDTSKVETGIAEFEEKITEYIEKPITGYILKEADELTITEVPANNILNVYYIRGQFDYSIHYHYQGVEDESKVIKGTATYGDVISTYEDKNITGYKLDYVDTDSITITENSANNVMNVYYIKDVFEYTVEYYYDGVIKDSETVIDIAAFEEEITEYTDKIIPGYVLVKTENNPLKITELSENNIMRIYYEKGEYNYTVHYFYEGIENISKIEKSQAIYGDVIENYADKNIKGYTLEKVENFPLTVSENEENNAINVYYVKDVFEYTVHYFYEGIEDTSKVEVISAKYEDIILTYKDKNIQDFKLVREENIPLTITDNPDNNVINIYYEKNITEYTVHYFYDGVENEEMTETLLGKIGTEITDYEEKNIPGYKLEKTENLPLKVTKNSDENVINIYYVKDNFEYKVEYYYDGILDETKTEKNIALYQSEVTEYIDKNIEGYKLDKVEGTPLTIKEIVKDNVIKVYYVINADDTKELHYVVNYYKDGVLDEEATQVVKDRVQILQPDYLPVDKTQINIIDKYEGYKLDATATKEIPNFANNGEVINIYYIRKDASVVVKYYERNSETELSETETLTGKVFDEYVTLPKEIEGYTLISDSENITGTMEENQIIVIYYYAKNVKAKIKYVDKANGSVIEEEIIDTKDGDILDVIAKDIENYVLVESPEDTTIEVGKEDITLTFYYSKISEGVIEKHIDKITNEIIETNVYEGKEGDSYETAAIEIEGYDLVVDMLPENPEGTMTAEIIEVKYYYIRKANIIVEYIDYITGEKLSEKDENGEEIDSTIMGEGHESDEYTTSPKEFDGYVLTETPENATGTLKVEKTVDEEGNEVINITTKVVYKYGKVASVRIEYIDSETNEKIAEDDIIQGYEGKEYTVEAKEIAKYAVVESPENISGEMKIEVITNEETGEITENSEIVLTFKYVKKDGKVIVRYIDKATNEVLDETEITGRIDTEYETQEKEITDYTYLSEERPENASGTITEETIIVNYYYIKVAKVVVQFIDKYTGEVVYEQVVHKGYNGEEYKTVPPEIDGYILIKEEYPSNAEGKYETETQEVTYYYARKAKVEISYIDAETGAELLEKEYIKGKEGDSYTTEAKEVNYYKLQEVDKQEGKMEVVVTTDEETGMERVNNITKVTYKYRKAYFDISVDKTVKEIIVDGTNRNVNNNKLAKVEIHRKEISEANVKVIYQIKVTNDGELPGSAVVADIIPEGLTFNSSDNKAWTPKGDRAFIETEELTPGESATYEMILTWNGTDEIGTFTNKIEVADVENTPDYEEQSTRNNKSEATVIIVTSTGIGVVLSQINMTDVANVGILSFYFVLIYVFVIKRKKD